jgi:hypothetical protein
MDASGKSHQFLPKRSILLQNILDSDNGKVDPARSWSKQTARFFQVNSHPVQPAMFTLNPATGACLSRGAIAGASEPSGRLLKTV